MHIVGSFSAEANGRRVSLDNERCHLVCRPEVLMCRPGVSKQCPARVGTDSASCVSCELNAPKGCEADTQLFLLLLLNGYNILKE